MTRSQRRVKASEAIVGLMLAAGLILSFGCNDNGSGGSGDPHVKVFVTSDQFRGNFPGGVGLDGADASCTLAATNAGLSGNWTAWLSDSTTDAADRILDSASGYQLLDGTVIANNLADLVDGTLAHAIDMDEDLTTISDASDETWTATDPDGTRSGGGTCANWTSIDVGDVAQIGLATAMDADWTDVNNIVDTCDTFNRLYCFADAISN